MKRATKRAIVLAAIIWSLVCLPATAGTIVRFTISGLSFDVQLTDEDTPATVANFLRYVNEDLYDGTVIHRSIPGFIWQGGGFGLNVDPLQALPIPTYEPVVNEPVFSNTVGTIAMAKLDGDPDSATSQWFFNVGDNSSNLDFQNGGFTVFGYVLGDGMSVVNAVAGLPRIDLSADIGPPYGGNFTDMPYYTVNGVEGISPLVVQDIAVVPEPSSLVLAALGIAAAAALARRGGRGQRASVSPRISR
jgi:cyclophilin family peptidyl-prolyl cis-trans isomerase